MAQSAEQRLGVADYGDVTSTVGNFLTYPRRIVIAVLKHMFSQPDFFTKYPDSQDSKQNPFLYVEREDGSVDASSKIIIGDQAVTQQSEANESRPRIVVDRASGSFQNGHFTQQNGGWGTATREYQDLFASDLTIRCVDRYKLASELLALATSMSLTMFNKAILRGSKLHHVSIPVVGPTVPERSDSAVDQYATTLTMRTEQPVGWKLSTLESDVVTDICLLLQEVRI